MDNKRSERLNELREWAERVKRIPTSYRASQIPESLQELILSLKEEDSIYLEIHKKMNTQTFRNRVYQFLHQAALKPLFRLSLDGRKLRIQRLLQEDAYICISQQEVLDSVENFVLDNLIDTNDEDKALEIIQQGLEDGRLNKSQALLIIQEWKRAIVGKTEPSVIK